MKKHLLLAALLLVIIPELTGCGRTGRVANLRERSPARGYLAAHRGIDAPYALAGGPIRMTITQQEGGVHLALPDHRHLDPVVFGMPAMPLAYGGTPLACGVPPAMRVESDGDYDSLNETSPFGVEHRVLPKGRLSLQALDVTATDAALSQDSIRLEASWEDERGDSYAVICTTVIPQGVEYPFFGGVVTNHILHGFTRIGTPLMPTSFAYLAFWGNGVTRKNGEIMDEDLLVQGMLTEYVRGEDYALGFDEDVSPTARHFQLLVSPFRIGPDGFEEEPVNTGFVLENGAELPFWYVTFDNLTVKDERVMPLYRNGNGEAYTNSLLAPEASTTVMMTDQLDYVPERITIRTGETVQWENISSLIHTVTADPGKAIEPAHASVPEGADTFDSGTIPPGGTFSYTFRVPGVYRYFSIPYEAAGMVAVVEVR